MKEETRHIPLAIKRQVRQRCGFGCVICGMPLYEYEHMEEWASVKRHVASEITLLCKQHHHEKTNGLLPVKTVRAANLDPYNLRNGMSKPYLFHYLGDEDVEVVLGSNSFHGRVSNDGESLTALIVDDIPLVQFVMRNGQLMLNLLVFDSDNETILVIKENELTYATDTWDIQLVGTTLTIREAHYKLLIEIDFKPPNKISVTRGKFLCNGFELLVQPDKIIFPYNGNKLSGCSIYGATHGVIFGNFTGQRGMAFAHSRVRINYPVTNMRTLEDAFTFKNNRSGA